MVIFIYMLNKYPWKEKSVWSYHNLSQYYLPRFILFQLIFKRTLEGRHYHVPQFTEKGIYA